MNRTVFGALAVLATSTLGYASETEEWLGLDKELESLRSTMTASQGGEALGISGFFRTSYTYDSDADLGGFNIDNVRLDFSATVEDFEIYVQYEASGTPQAATDLFAGVERVLDAYGAWNLSEEFKVTFGQFRPAFLNFSKAQNEDTLFFANRSFNEFFWASRDAGVELSGNFESFRWWAGLSNGFDGTADELAFFGRVAFGTGEGIGTVQGAMDASEDLAFQVGGGLFLDDSIEEATGEDALAWALDAQLAMDIFSAWGDIVYYDEGYSVLAGGGGDDTTWELAGTVMFVPERWEAGVRYEDQGDVFIPGLTALTFGINHYRAGHDAKFFLDLAIVDNDIQDTEQLTLGTNLGW